MTEIVVATLNVTFGEDTASSEGQLKLEIDDRPTGLNKGDTSFSPGDQVGYIIFKDSNVTVIEHMTTAGGTTAAGSITKEIDEQITFTNSDTGSLGYPPDGAVSLQWLGRCYEIYTDDNNNTGVRAQSSTPNVTHSNLKMTDGKKVAGILRAQYDTTGTGYYLRNVPEDFEEVMIIAIGEIT